MRKIIISLFYLLGILSLIYFNLFRPAEQEQFIALASAFLQGKLYFLSDTFDASLFNNHLYWPLGPLPAIILMPFVYIFGDLMKQGYLLFFINLMNIFLLTRIARKLNNNTTTSVVLSFSILFSTTYLGIALIPWSWYFAQSLGFCLILLALEAYFFKRSWLVIGTFIALAYSTRISLIFITFFFILNIFYSDLKNRIKIKNLFMLLLPIAIFIVLLGFYNYSRFNNPLETGYSTQLLEGPVATRRDIGLWNLNHIPNNLYYMFLKAPEPVLTNNTNLPLLPFLKIDGSGLSILFTAPIFIWILFSNWHEIRVRFAAITILIMIFVLSGSFTNGSWQFGYRYAIDYFPLLFIMLVYSFKKNISYKFLLVTFVGFLSNLYFISTIF